MIMKPILDINTLYDNTTIDYYDIEYNKGYLIKIWL